MIGTRAHQTSVGRARALARVRDSLCGLALLSGTQPVVLPALILTEPQATQGQDRLHVPLAPELLGPLHTFVHQFHPGLGDARADRPAPSAVIGVGHVRAMGREVANVLLKHTPRMSRAIVLPHLAPGAALMKLHPLDHLIHPPVVQQPLERFGQFARPWRVGMDRLCHFVQVLGGAW